MYNLTKSNNLISFIPIILLLSVFVFVNSEVALKQLHILFRHGERSPTKTYPNDPYTNFNWSGGWGHLSNRGKLQMYTLGQTFRTLYGNFLPELYWPEEVNVTSSYADRCLMSAELFTAGLFPPKGPQIWSQELLWQPIPIHYQPRSQDNMIAMKSKCPTYDKAFEETQTSQKVLNITSSNENLMQYLTEKTGMKVDNIGTVETLFNTLEIEKLHDLSLPPWINDTLLETMKKLGAQNLALYSETQFMKRMKGGVLLKYIITSMKKSLEGKQVPLLNLYSGHDLTIVHILRALNLVDTIKPEFGASLVFELYTDGEIKIKYVDAWNGITEEKTAGSCNSPCSLTSWKQVLEPILPLNWLEECETKT